MLKNVSKHLIFVFTSFSVAIIIRVNIFKYKAHHYYQMSVSATKCAPILLVYP